MRWSNWKNLTVAVSALACAAGVALGSGGPPNDQCTSALVAGTGVTHGTNIEATGDEPSCGIGSRTVWYMFTAPVDGTFSIDTFGAGTDYDTVLAAFTNCGGSELACNDDSLGLKSKITVSLLGGQSIKIAVAGFAGSQGQFDLNIAFAGQRCCEPWDNGEFDRRNAQTSQVAFGEDWRTVGRITFDDFWLCEGNVYRIRTTSGKMCTDSVVPKAQVAILTNCDGRPGRPVAIADSIPRDLSNLPPELRGLECVFGTIEIHETGELTPEGFRVIDVVATFPKLWLKGGQYWVTFIGYSGTADPDEQFFWGTSGNNVVKGKPGLFFDSVDQTWTDIDEICCGCTDFNFCIQGDSCKILRDNGSLDFILNRLGGPALEGPAQGNLGSPSLQNGGRTADKVRSADDFVVPPCEARRLCYVEAWLLTNCSRARLDIYRGDCHKPAEEAPIFTTETSCLTAVTQFRGQDGVPLTLYKAEFYDWDSLVLEPGNYWVSVYALGDGSQNSRGYFVYNFLDRCRFPCPISFNPAAVKGAPYDISHWNTVTPPADLAFLVAVDHGGQTDPDESQTPRTCASDFNHDGTVTLQDLFDYLAAFFAGCP